MGIVERETRDLEEAKQYGVSSFAKELLNVNDSLGLAIINTDLESSEPKEQLEILIEGINMTNTNAQDALSHQNIATFQPNIGDHFDHNEHNVVKKVEEKSDKPSVTVTRVVKPGYKRKNKVLRLADVEVLAKVTPPKPKPVAPKQPKEDKAKDGEAKESESKENGEKEIDDVNGEKVEQSSSSSSSSDSEVEPQSKESDSKTQ
eukprot:CAMPEP_0117055182 /NCGR_PEP_ID=MMETSP0472-20121206/38248_1 /TAXON_ID=693140 ORGANISM="Tiarina fusus, Strain LIS" /NCGR_SAMPLE_ID=MMETSP0472 /ASSEMBLY_ACC=CAM_ASM_000603 /LENGTH=203 /DNA_ID=CAMNT_0004771067 /DNA_START=213 /DNA_END=824 /DNA_ORIENTATION=-